jgi:hypothetical protein
VTSRTTRDFRQDFAQLPKRVQEQARRAYRLFVRDPNHPSLHFKKLPPFEDVWSVRITRDCRSIGRRDGNLIVWFFIGTHTDYDKMLDRLK